MEGLKKHNYENFWEINQGLCDRSVTELKKYAIRIFSNRHHTYVQPNIDVNPVENRNTEEQKEDNQEDMMSPTMLTLGDVLIKTFPRLFETELGDNGEIEISKKRKFEVVVQGVEADMNTPMYWMQLNMSYLDNFLYICLHFM